MKPVPFLLAALGAGLLLAGCSSSRIPNCPSAAILADTATVTGFKPGAPADPSGEAYTASFATVSTSCDFTAKTQQSVSQLHFTVRATRAPSAQGAAYDIPYYVAVTQGDRLLGKQVYDIRIAFAPGSALAQTEQTIDRTTIHVEKGRQPTDYQLLVGFQLTKTQRAYNQKRNRYRL